MEEDVPCFMKTAQQSEQRTAGSLRDLRQFSGFDFFLHPKHCPSPPASAANAHRWTI